MLLTEKGENNSNNSSKGEAGKRNNHKNPTNNNQKFKPADLHFNYMFIFLSKIINVKLVQQQLCYKILIHPRILEGFLTLVKSTFGHLGKSAIKKHFLPNTDNSRRHQGLLTSKKYRDFPYTRAY